MRRNKTKGYSILCSTKQSIYVLGYREGTFHDKLNYDEQNYPFVSKSLDKFTFSKPINFQAMNRRTYKKTFKTLFQGSEAALSNYC